MVWVFGEAYAELGCGGGGGGVAPPGLGHFRPWCLRLGLGLWIRLIDNLMIWHLLLIILWLHSHLLFTSLFCLSYDITVHWFTSIEYKNIKTFFFNIEWNIDSSNRLGNCLIQIKSENVKCENECAAGKFFLKSSISKWEYGRQMGQPPPKKYNPP